MTIAAMEKSIGDVVREKRKALGLTLEQLCVKLTEYDAGNLSRFEKGQQRIVEERLDEIATALGTTTWELFKARELTSQETAVPSASEVQNAFRAVWPFPTAIERYMKLPPIDKARCATYIEATVDAWEAHPPLNGTTGH